MGWRDTITPVTPDSTDGGSGSGDGGGVTAAAPKSWRDTITPVEDPSDLLPSLKGMAQGIVDKTKQAGAGLADAVRHPINTAGDIGDWMMMGGGPAGDNTLVSERSLRNIPVAGPAVESINTNVAGLGGDLDDILKGTSGSGQKAADAYRAKQAADDTQHDKDHPLVDFLQKGAGLAAGATVAGPLAAAEGAASQVTPMSASMALNAYMKSKAAGNDHVTALKDARNAAIGMGLVGNAAEGASNVAADAAPAIANFADNRSAGALGWTKAIRRQLGNDAATKAGRVGLDEGVVTPLASTADKIDRMTGVQDRSGQVIGDTMSTLDNTGIKEFNPLNTAIEAEKQLGPMGNEYKSGQLGKTLGTQYDNILNDISNKGADNISFADAQRLKQYLGNIAYPKGQAPENLQQVQQAYGIVNKSLDDAVDRGAQQTGDSDLLANLQKARGDYKASTQSLGALDNKLAATQGNNQLGLSDWAVAAPQLALNPVKAAGTVVAKQLLGRYGNNMAAVGADTLSKVLESAPDTFGKFAPILAAASQRGPDALTATHQVLLKTNPEYSKTLEGAK